VVAVDERVFGAGPLLPMMTCIPLRTLCRSGSLTNSSASPRFRALRALAFSLTVETPMRSPARASAPAASNISWTSVAGVTDSPRSIRNEVTNATSVTTPASPIVVHSPAHHTLPSSSTDEASQ